MTADPADYSALARRYMDLWQQEMAKMAQDPATAGAWTELFQGMMRNASAAWAVAPAATTSGQSDGRTAPTSPSSTAPSGGSPGAASAAAAPGDGGLAVTDVLRRIDARLDAIEQRLTALETTAPARRRTKQPKP